VSLSDSLLNFAVLGITSIHYLMFTTSYGWNQSFWIQYTCIFKFGTDHLHWDE